ncbi:hypothetical protein Taro_047669 [Colocasia esculenta]|uniref:CBF1-interacting co-repressor CIR N-terminal domain-containing protein n=1 Tax=Colocasia esculenta TaxID=4460 RepID=A0A843WWN5_COLES|nr:hypothetical protein [Colocasia esculenta]
MMEDDGESGGPRLSKRFAGGKLTGGEVDYKTKAGTAWSHSYLNQKPWHPLSYPNQRRKWIAEQTHSQREHRAEEVAREFAQEQEFFRQTSLLNDKEKEKMEMMKAVSFMYLRPPGYNAESAKAAEIADEQKKVEQNDTAGESSIPPATVYDSASSMSCMHYQLNKLGSVFMQKAMSSCRSEPKVSSDAEKKKARAKDVFGRTLPTEEEFEVLKNAPRLETGVPARVKPFAVEIRNVRCVRCGKFGHQSGDRECPLKDAIMPNEESRLKRDDPLMAIKAQTSSSEPLKWELKQMPGMSPPRGGFDPGDPNQQIVAADDIFDEYGGFLSGGDIPALLSNFKSSKTKKHSKSKRKHKHKLHASGDRKAHGNRSPSSSEADPEKGRRISKRKHEKRRRKCSDSSESESSAADGRRKRKGTILSNSGTEVDRRKSKSRHKKRRHSASGDSSGSEHRQRRRKHRHRRSGSVSESD